MEKKIEKILSTCGTLIPDAVLWAAKKLRSQSFDVAIVGGCVRDMLLGIEPGDWDMTTSAKPEEMLEVFHGEKIIETGLKHGTVTVVKNHNHIEITTFRTDGTYSDCRHPDKVEYTTNLEKDLMRRDFTINAIAISIDFKDEIPVFAFVDPFHGAKDLQAGLIKCVGAPEARFSEDALRIMRALRFASRLAFRVDEDTKSAMRAKSSLLNFIAVERVKRELDYILMDCKNHELFMEFWDVLAVLIPEIKPMVGFKQYNPHHIYDVFEHTAVVICSAPRVLTVRWAALLHDVGKPSSFTFDDNGIGHFYGHAGKSVDIAEKIMNRLKFDTRSKREICKLIRYHDGVIDNNIKAVNRKLRQMDEATLKNLIALKRADNLGQNPEFFYRQQEYDALENLISQAKLENKLINMKNLSINGYDLMEMGLAGKELGVAKKLALEAVIEERVHNSRAAVMDYLRKEYMGKEEYIVVIGGLARDIEGRSFQGLVREDSNPGKVSWTLGGVGRNIAHNLSLLGVKVKLITAIGDDYFADIAIKTCEADGIDLSDSLKVKDGTTATYLYVSDPAGVMDIAVADMAVFDEISTDFIESKADVINGASAIVLDTNARRETIEYIRETFSQIPIFIDPVSTAKAEKLKGNLKGFYGIKPNKMEAELITGIGIYDESSMRKAADALLAEGVKNVYISLGSEGVYAADGKEAFLEPCLPVDLANVTGGGDAFMAAVVKAALDGRTLQEQVKFGLGASAMAVEDKATINKNITEEKVLLRANLK